MHIGEYDQRLAGGQTKSVGDPSGEIATDMARSSNMKLLLRLFVSAFALFIATLLFSENAISSVFGRTSNIELTDPTFSGPWFGTLLLVAVIFGVVNAVLQPIIRTIGCAAYALTLGLIALVVNGALLMLTEWIGGLLGLGFEVANFWPSAVLGALVIGVVSWLMNMVVKGN